MRRPRRSPRAPPPGGTRARSSWRHSTSRFRPGWSRPCPSKCRLAKARSAEPGGSRAVGTRMRIRSLAGSGLVALVALLALAPSSRADVVQGTRSELLTERAHTIDLTLSPGHATLRVRRVLDHQGPRHHP